MASQASASGAVEVPEAASILQQAAFRVRVLSLPTAALASYLMAEEEAVVASSLITAATISPEVLRLAAERARLTAEQDRFPGMAVQTGTLKSSSITVGSRALTHRFPHRLGRPISRSAAAPSLRVWACGILRIY